MTAPAVRIFPDDPTIGLVGVRFPVELRVDDFDPEQPSTWPALEGRLEYVGGRLLYMPPCADFQQDVAMDVAYVLRSWTEAHPEFIVGGNEAGMKLGGDIRAADAAVWLAEDTAPRSGRVRTSPPILAVEIAGEDEDEGSLLEKAKWYLDHGVSVVWIVLPSSREVLVTTEGSVVRCDSTARIASHPRLPGLEPRVRDVFVQIDRTRPK